MICLTGSHFSAFGFPVPAAGLLLLVDVRLSRSVYNCKAAVVSEKYRFSVSLSLKKEKKRPCRQFGVEHGICSLVHTEVGDGSCRDEHREMWYLFLSR